MRNAPVRALTASLGLALATGACARSQPPAPQAAAAVVPVLAVRQGAVTPRTTLSGVIAPLQNVGITSSLAEPADAVYVKEGDRVTRGQRLALLDTADLRAQLAEYQATVASNAAKASQTYDQAGLTIVQNANTVEQARAAVRQAQLTLANDTLNLTRDADLLRQGYIPQQQYDTLAATVGNDRQAVSAAQVTLQNDIKQVAANGTTASGLQGSMVAAAQATTQISQAQADQIRVQIAKATIVSPIDGVVVNRNLNPGEFPGTRQLFTLQETSRVYAVLNGSSAQISGLRTGGTASVVASSLPGKQFTGSVAGILNALTPGSTNFVVKVVLANPTGALRPGMAVSGSATLPTTRGLMIPDTAFLDTTNGTVQIVSGSTVQTAQVTMLADDGKNAIVSGLSPGASVVVNGQSGLTDGQTVAPQQLAQR
ncbi:MAG TPA: efflux RND transporter periplasmic adaptor subunit [Candidatus Elarobacter sp.]|jgi:HlyD family secretion protein